MVDPDFTLDDPCHSRQPFSFRRFAVLALVFLSMVFGIFLLILVADRPYGIQLSSMLVYTAAVVLYTFSANGNKNPPFLLACPLVRRKIPNLIWRHLGFLAALYVIQTTAFQFRAMLPTYWNTPISKTEPTRLAVILGAVCGCLALVQILSNRSLLERAHRTVSDAG